MVVTGLCVACEWLIGTLPPASRIFDSATQKYGRISDMESYRIYRHILGCSKTAPVRISENTRTEIIASEGSFITPFAFGTGFSEQRFGAAVSCGNCCESLRRAGSCCGLP